MVVSQRRPLSADYIIGGETIGIRVAIGHSSENVGVSDVVVYSSAVSPRNPEIREAEAHQVPVIERAEMLAELMRMKDGVAIAGSHGKTTTTSLLGSVLQAGGLDPTIVVGGRVPKRLRSISKGADQTNP